MSSPRVGKAQHQRVLSSSLFIRHRYKSASRLWGEMCGVPSAVLVGNSLDWSGRDVVEDLNELVHILFIPSFGFGIP